MTDYLLSLTSPKKSYSIDRLRAAYTDLLRHIDLDNDNLRLRRRVDDEDVECQKKLSRFSFRRSVLPPEDNNINRKNAHARPRANEINADNSECNSKNAEKARKASNTEELFSNQNPHINPVALSNKTVDLATAFRMLAATRSPVKEGGNFWAVTVREDSSVCGMQRAKALEKRVVELICQIGEIVVNAGDDIHNGPGESKRDCLPVRTDPVFEYFCEKCILSLFVEIAKEVRHGGNQPFQSPTPSKLPSSSSVHGVVWSGSVKAQVYKTVSLLISDTRNQSVIYYFFSNNYINELIKCILPLKQWTEPALAQMLPSYVNLLKNLTLQIAKNPDLFPFLTIENNIEVENDDFDEGSTRHTEFPLFSAALETATSVYAQSDSQTYATCLAIIVNLMQISHDPIHAWISHSNISQRVLADHLCQRLLDRYYRMANLTRGPVVNFDRHNSIVRQLVRLEDEMGMIREIFWCGVRGMDVRLCESLLQRVVFLLLKNLMQLPPSRPFLVVGLIDADVIPEREASAQVATVFFTYMFCNLLYVPFQRMMSVALFHQNSTSILSRLKPIPQSTDSSGDYVLMPALSDIVNDDKLLQVCANPFRREIFRTLEGDCGEWRASATACLLQSVLNTDAMDTDTVVMSGLISIDESKSSLDHSIATFLSRSHNPSAITARALECSGYLGLMILYRSLTNCIQKDEKIGEVSEIYRSNSPVWNALKNTRDHMCRQAMMFLDFAGVSDIFLDLTEAIIKSRYTISSNEGSPTFTYHLSRYGNYENMAQAEFLVRQSRCISSNDVEKARFYIKMGIHFRALCKAADRMFSDIQSKKSKRFVDYSETADTLTRTIGGLYVKPKTGAVLDLTGRMLFRFQSALNPAERNSSDRAFSAESPYKDATQAFSSTSYLTLVLDPTDLFVVKPMAPKMEEKRGLILFSISIRNIIAAAVDQAWLHVAIRNPDTIANVALIKNGNMALHFESAGTCLIVKQYLDRSREVLRQDLLNKIPVLLQ